MATIKDFFKEREKRQNDPNVDYRERIRQHKLSVFIKSTVLIVSLVALIVILNIFWNEKSYTTSKVLESYPVSVVNGATAKNLGGSVLIYSKDGASCIDSKGKAVWNQSFEMQSPIVSINEDTVAIGDYNGRNIYVANSKGILGVVKTNLPIRDVAVSNNGVVAAVLDDVDVIRLFVYDGNSDTETPIVESKATMNKSGYPISVSLSPNGKIMMVSYFYVDSGNMKSSVSFYNFGEVGSNEVDNFVSGFDYVDTVMPYVSFPSSNTAFGVSDDRIVFFKGNEVPSNVATALLDEKALGVYHNSDYIGMVFLDTTGTALYRLDVYNAAGTKLSSTFFDMEFTDIVFNKDLFIVYGGSNCMISTVKGDIKFEGAFDKTVSLLLPTSSSYKFLLVTGDSLDTVELN
ncbi:MAG: DUF5711 family protein [Lachnospiraceae bacterium]|nr:DUF5711 family protein [Lachnospiraceae bacterium]